MKKKSHTHTLELRVENKNENHFNSLLNSAGNFRDSVRQKVSYKHIAWHSIFICRDDIHEHK